MPVRTWEMVAFRLKLGSYIYVRFVMSIMSWMPNTVILNSIICIPEILASFMKLGLLKGLNSIVLFRQS